MKISSRTLKIMAAAAGTLSVPAGAWYAAEQAIRYEEEAHARMRAGAPVASEPSVVVQIGEEVLSAYYYIGIRTGLIAKPPCPLCGLG